MADTTPVPNRGERVLLVIAASLVGISLLAIVAILLAALFGASGTYNEGVWPVLALIPVIALPLAFLLVIARLVVATLRRARES